MASTRTSSLFRLAERPVCARCLYRYTSPKSLRWSSTASDAPPTLPLLAKIKEELKTAMRAKDKERLSVLRGTISEINQAASGPNPIKSDMQIVGLLRKRRAATQQAADEARRADRQDLVDKSDKEISVVDELTAAVPLMDPLEIRQVVRRTIETLRASGTGQLKPGPVLKELLKPEGELADKPLDNKVLAELVREELFSNHGNS